MSALVFVKVLLLSHNHKSQYSFEVSDSSNDKHKIKST